MAFVAIHEPGDPTLVMLHGTGGNEVEMASFGRRLSTRAGLLSLRGNEPEGASNRWFRRFAEGVFDEENLRMRAAELAAEVQARLSGTRRIAVGYSNGANIAAAVLLLHPDAFDGAVLFAPMVPFEPESLPNLDGKPVLMVCGEADPIVPRTNAMSLASMLHTAGADLEVLWHPGGHGIGEAEMNVAAHWVARHAVPGKPQ